MRASTREDIERSSGVFPGPVPVKYLYRAPDVATDRMVVVFSGFHGREVEGLPGMFNYVRTLTDVQMHQLFIIDDYDGLPCYYVGRGGRHDYEAAVAALIFSWLRELGIDRAKVTLAGSSKGGSAALYFALRYGFGRALPGGAQYRVGSYLYGLSNWSREKLLAPICGMSDHLAARDRLDEVFASAVRAGTRGTHVDLHVGSGDPTLQLHVEPLLLDLAAAGVPHTLEMADYSAHGQLAEHYPPFLRSRLG